MGEQFERTIHWEHPDGIAARAREMSGIEFLQALAAGDIPPAPIAAHMNMTLTEVRVGEAMFEAIPDSSLYNPIGSVHGGFYATLLDSACGCAVQSTLPAGQGYTSLEIKVNFLRPMTEDTGTVRVRGWVTKPGSRAAFAEAEITDAAGKVLATASSVCLVFPTDAS